MASINPTYFFPGFLPPTLIVPTQERVDQYLNPEFDYGAYLGDLRRRGPVEGGETQLENIITQCIEGEFREALDGLLNLPEERFDDFQRIAYFRLAGGLLEDLGDLDRSRAYLRRALDLSKKLGVKHAAGRVQDNVQPPDHRSTTPQRGQLGTLRRFLRREISMSLELHDLFDSGALARYEAARKLDAPVFLGYQEYARTVADAKMIQEEFKASLREEGSVYSRSGFPSELAWLNLSLWMAYTCGDTRRARYARTNFGRWAILHGLREDDSGLLATGVQELIRSRVLDDLENLLARVGHLVHARIDVNGYFRHFRPLDVSGPAAAPMWRILHMLVKTMVGYADDESRQALRGTYSQGLARYLAGQPGMAADQTYAVSYFLDAYSELGPTGEDIGRLLTWAGEKQVGPGRIHNVWTLVKAYEWDDPEAWPLAERTLALLKALYPKGEAEEYASLFHVLGHSLPPKHREALDAWVAEHLPPTAQFNYWVNGTHERVKDTIFPMLRAFMEANTRELRTTQGESSLSFGGPIVASYVPAVFGNYRDVEADAERIEITRDYLEALANSHIHARFKADGYAYLAEAMRYVSAEVKASVRRQLALRRPAQEQSREVDRGFFGELGRSIDAQLSLWRLRARVGIPTEADDLPLLTTALTDARARARRIAAETAAIVLREQGQEGGTELRQAVLALLYSRLFDANAWVRRAAVTGLIYSEVHLDSVWGTGVLLRTQTLIQTDQPFVATDILRTLASQVRELRQQPNGTGLLAAAALAEVGKVNPHRDVRMAAAEVAFALTARAAEEGHLAPGQ